MATKVFNAFSLIEFLFITYTIMLIDHVLLLFFQTSCHGKVASGTQVVFYEARVDPDQALELDRRHISHSTRGLL